MFNRIIRVFIKELKVVMRDPRSRIILILPPILQLMVFSFAATHELKNASIAFMNRDSGPYGRELVEKIKSARRIFSRTQIVEDRRRAERLLDSGKILALVTIDQDFSRDLSMRRPGNIQIILDGRRANASLLASGYISRIARSYVMGKARIKEAVDVRWRNWFNPNLDPKWSTVSALVGILVNLVALIITSLSVARERELGTFEQLLVSPLRPLEILVGKAVPAVMLGLFEGSIMTLLVLVVFGLPFRGSFFTLLFGMFLFLLATVGVGLFISSLARTQQQAFLGAFTYMVPAVLLSGFATPVENIPIWLRWVSHIDPLKYMIALSRSVFIEGMTFGEVSSMIYPLIPIAAVTLTASAMLFKRRLG